MEMEVSDRVSLEQAVDNMKMYPSYRKVLSIFLKHEIQQLLGKLAETGEESVVMMTRVIDGTHCVIGSTCGERFLQQMGNTKDVVTHFRDHFIRYCSSEAPSGCDVSLTKYQDETELGHVTQSSEQPSKCVKETVTQQMEMVEKSPGEINSSNSTCISSSRVALRSCQRCRCTCSGRKSDETVDTVTVSNDKVSRTSDDEKVSKLVRNIMKQYEHSKDHSSTTARTLYGKASSSKSINMDTSYGKSRVTKWANIHKQSDKSVEETVSQLVRNIMQEAEEKEKQKTPYNSSNCLGRRKRAGFDYNQWINDGYSCMNSSAFKCSQRKRPRKISECFPSVHGTVLRNKGVPTSESDNDSVSVLIKKEPDTDADYTVYDSSIAQHDIDNQDQQEELAVDGREFDTDNAYIGEDGSEVQTSSLFADHSIVTETDTNNSDGANPHAGSEGSRSVLANAAADTSASDDAADASVPFDTSTVKVEILNDNEMELPYVEECYENRTGQVDNFKWEKDEIPVADVQDGWYRSSHKGKFNLIHQGYVYIRDKVGKNDTTYWKCGRNGCKGRVIQRGDEKIRTKDHIHSALIQF